MPGLGPNGGNSKSSNNARQEKTKGVEKKIGKQPIKEVKQKVLKAKEKLLAKEAKKESHDERKAKFEGASTTGRGKKSHIEVRQAQKGSREREL